MGLSVVDCTDENNGSGLRSWPLPDKSSRLKAIHARHVHIKKDDGEVLVQEAAQGVAAGGGTDKILIQLRQDSLVREKLVGTIIDDENVDLLVGGCGPVTLDRKRHLTVQPIAQEREQPLGVDWLCNVIACARIDAF